MSEENEEVAAGAPALGVGDTLRAAREAKGLSLDQVASETRISSRHLEQMEAGHFDTLPGRTYAIGFAKTYAKLVGLDPAKIAEDVREEMDLEPITHPVGTSFEPGEAARGPSGTLVWFSIFAVILLLAGLFFAGRTIFGGEVEWDSLVEEEPVAEQAPAGDEDAEEDPAAGGPVVFTAEDVVWVRFTDADGLLLMEKEMAAGETYTVPADADGPVLITGRPDLLAITIGGQSVPRLSTEPLTVVDVPVSAEALLARDEEALAEDEEEAQATPRPQPARTSAPRPTPRPRAADAESATSAPAPTFVSEPVVQDVPAQSE